MYRLHYLWLEAYANANYLYLDLLFLLLSKPVIIIFFYVYNGSMCKRSFFINVRIVRSTLYSLQILLLALNLCEVAVV